MIFERFPRTGIPDAFESLSEYEDYLKLLVSTGCIADRQLAVWERTHDMKAVVDHIIAETYEGLNVQPRPRTASIS